MISEFAFTDRARPVVEIGIGATHGLGGVTVWDAARWDTPGDVWAGTEPTWRDVTCDVFRYECSYGRASTIERFLPGTATVLVNNASGWADPSHDVTPGVLSMRPGREIRMGVAHRTLGAVWLWRGYIDGVVPVYDPVNPDTVELHCIDALGEVNRAKAKPLPAPVGAGEQGSARVNRILDAAAWSRSRRDIRPSPVTLIASDLAGQTADLLGQAADSVGGAVFGDQTGTVCFRPRDWQTYNPIDPPDGTIGNGAAAGADVVFGAGDVVFGADDVVYGAGGAADVCPVRWERPFERADISTRVILGRDPATAVQLDDGEGIARYGIEPFERTNLLTESDSFLMQLAQRMLEVRDEATAPRVRSVTLNAATSAESLDLQTTVDVFKPSRYQCRLVYPRGDVFDEMHFATGVRHIVDPASWETLINLDLSAPFANAGHYWDGAWWDRSIWTVVVADLLTEARRLLDADLLEMTRG
jgi:hypothetical protein